MISKARGGHVALSLAVFGAAAIGAVRSVSADSYTLNTATQGQAEPNTFFTGTNRFAVEGSTPGGSNFTSWGLLDFNSAAVTNGTTVGLPDFVSVTSVNSMTIQLTDLAESFARAGVVDVYLSSDLSSTSGLRWLNSAAPQGIGGQLANGTGIGASTAPISIGQINYTPVAGTVYNTSVSLTSDIQTYIKNQLNSGGTIRVLFAPDSATVAADFKSVTTGATAPTINFDLTTQTAATNTFFTLPGNAKSTTITIPRIVNTATSASSLTITNSGTDAGNYTVIGVAGDGGNPLSGNGVGQSGLQPIAANGGTSIVTVGIAPANVQPGLPSFAGQPATSTVIIRDRLNPNNDGNITVTINATQVVANRLIDQPGGSGSGLDFSNGTIGVLAGLSYSMPTTLSTFNTAVGVDTTSTSLTTVELPAAAVAAKALSSTASGVTDQAALSAGNDVVFDNAQTENRNVTFSPSGAKGGLYKTKAFFDGYLLVPMTQLDTAVGATSSPTANVYITTNVYQQANVSLTGTSPAFTLTNAKHTTNSVSTALGDIGARAAAVVTAASLVNAQGGYTIDPALIPGLSIGDGATVNGAAFTTAGKLNGTYTGTLSVTLENEQDIQGATLNDIGVKNFSLSATVTTNSGNGTANILSNGSLAGYNIHRGSGKDSTITFLAGTSTSGGNLSVGWANGVNTALSDKATVGNTASNLYVLQMSYDGTAVTNGTSSPVLAANIGNKFIGAVNGNGSGTPLEINGAYDNNLVLGHYGIDTVNKVVWAVVNYAGDFEVTQRLLGDANGDGTVNLADVSTVLNNFGSTSGLWSSGNFEGSSTIGLTQLADVLNHFGTSVPSASFVVGTGNLGEIPEPASIGLLTVGLVPLLKRRRRA